MGLLDVIKTGKKEKEPRFCYRCNRDCSGFMAAMKLSDGKFACNDCYPVLTKLMKENGVMDDKFRFKVWSSAEVDHLIEYQEADKKRQELFEAEEEYFNGSVLVDRQHMWFRLKGHEEVFFIQQIKLLGIGKIVEVKNRYEFVAAFMMNNRYYKNLFFEVKIKPDAFFAKNRVKQVLECIMDFHESVCPNAAIDLESFK